MKTGKVLMYGTAVFLTIIGFAAVICGASLMVDPDGTGLGMTVELLKNSPFKDFFIPGLALVTVNGILSLIGAYFAFKNRQYAGLVTVFLGAAMITWISFQVYWIGWESWLQQTFLVVGVVEIVLGFAIVQQGSNHRIYRGRHDSHAH